MKTEAHNSGWLNLRELSGNGRGIWGVEALFWLVAITAKALFGWLVRF